MKHLRIAVPLTLTLLLAACGGDGPTPPPEPTPPTTPVEPPGEPSGPPPEVISFTATPSEITEGETTTLLWEVTGATTVSVAGEFVEPTGSLVVTPTETRMYYLDAINTDTDTFVNRTLTVTVNPTNQPDPTPTPGTDAEYYGEWLWTFTFDQTDSVLTGQISVTEDITTDSFSGSRGPYQLCAEDGTCDAGVKFGTGLIGTFELDDGDRLGMALFNDLGGDGFVQLIGYDSDGQLEVNDRGEDELSGDGLWAFSPASDGYLGTFTLAKISDLPVFQ